MGKADKGGMRSATMPKEKKEVSEGQLNPPCGLKYATEFGNPSDLDKNSAALANYVKANRMKY